MKNLHNIKPISSLTDIQIGILWDHKELWSVSFTPINSDNYIHPNEGIAFEGNGRCFNPAHLKKWQEAGKPTDFLNKLKIVRS